MLAGDDGEEEGYEEAEPGVEMIAVRQTTAESAEQPAAGSPCTAAHAVLRSRSCEVTVSLFRCT